MCKWLASDYLGKYFVKQLAGYNRNTRGCNDFVRAFYLCGPRNGMGYLTTLRILKKLIFLSRHFLIICSIQSNFGYTVNVRV